MMGSDKKEGKIVKIPFIRHSGSDSHISIPVTKQVGDKFRRASISVLEIGIRGYGKSRQARKNSEKIDNFTSAYFNGEFFRKFRGKAVYSRYNHDSRSLKNTKIEYILQCREITPSLMSLIDSHDKSEICKSIKKPRLESKIFSLIDSERYDDIYRFLLGSLYKREADNLGFARAILSEKLIIKAIFGIINSHQLGIDFYPGPKLNLSLTAKEMEQEIDVFMVFYKDSYFYNRNGNSLMGILEHHPNFRLYRTPRFDKKIK